MEGLQRIEYRDVPAPPHSLVHWEDVRGELEEQIVSMQTRRHCARCSKVFRIWDSISKLSCIKHVGMLMEFGKDGTRKVWSCCGKEQASYRPTERRGCVRCDHISSSLDNNDSTFTLRADIFQVMPVSVYGRDKVVECKFAYNFYTSQFYPEKSFVRIRICEEQKEKQQRTIY
jgi:hypothetical protein